MKSIFFAVSLAVAVAAQIKVNGVTTVPGGGSTTSTGSSASSTSGAATPASSPTSMSPSPTKASDNTPASMPKPTSEPDYNDDKPSKPYWEELPYSTFMSGGYKQLNCGYGYKKNDDGHCKPESWVSGTQYWRHFFSQPLQWNNQAEGGCYETTIIKK